MMLSMLIALISLAQTELNTSGNKATGTTGTVEYSVGYLSNTVTTGSSGYTIIGVEQPKEINNPLPIRVLSFSATKSNDKSALLKWSISGGETIDQIVVEKSTDGEIFSQFETVVSSKNNNDILTYTTKDSLAFKPLTYYRLQLKDIEGKITYSNIQVVSFNGNTPEIKVFPNPAVHYINIYSEKPTHHLTAIIIDMSGKKIGTYMLDNSINYITMDGVKSGIYLISIYQKNNIIKTFNLIKN